MLDEKLKQKFLEENEYIDYSNESIQKKASELFKSGMNEVEKTQAAYEFVRDEIIHTFDCKPRAITAKASEVLKYETGICDAKSNLLAALLRSQGIPTGFCYQHITLMKDDAQGYCIHCFNAVYLLDRWIKLDTRGNNQDIHARFSLEEPVLSYPNREQYDEFFWKGIYATPNQKTMKMLEMANSQQDILDHIEREITEKPDIME